MAAVAEETRDRSSYQRAYYLTNRDHILVRNKAWVDSNFARVKTRKAVHNRWRVYGLAETEYQALLTKQEGKCAVCTTQLDPAHVDHDHMTKQVRGLLCDRRNRGLGYFKDNAEALRAAANYVEGER